MFCILLYILINFNLKYAIKWYYIKPTTKITFEFLYRNDIKMCQPIITPTSHDEQVNENQLIELGKNTLPCLLYREHEPTTITLKRRTLMNSKTGYIQ